MKIYTEHQTIIYGDNLIIIIYAADKIYLTLVFYGCNLHKISDSHFISRRY